MMGLFQFSQEEMLCFFAVLVRTSVLVAILPFVGDRLVPMPVKILLSLAVSIVLFPALLRTGDVRPAEALAWGASASGIVATIALEALFGLALGFTAKMLFDGISFGANLVGTFMGFAAANTYDPHQETQTQVVAEIQMTIAMLIFLTMDGHHLMLRGALDSYRIVGIGRVGLGTAFSQKLVDMSSQVIRFGIQIAAPVAISLFAVNVAFGVMAKAMPQLNILVLSFAVSALIGLLVMLLGVPEFHSATVEILDRMGDWMEQMMVAMAGGK